jgi:hypothetical protein
MSVSRGCNMFLRPNAEGLWTVSRDCNLHDCHSGCINADLPATFPPTDCHESNVVSKSSACSCVPSQCCADVTHAAAAPAACMHVPAALEHGLSNNATGHNIVLLISAFHPCPCGRSGMVSQAYLHTMQVVGTWQHGAVGRGCSRAMRGLLLRRARHLAMSCTDGQWLCSV